MNNQYATRDAEDKEIAPLLTHLAEEPPATLTADIMARVQNERRILRMKKRRAWMTGLSAAAAAVILLPLIALAMPTLLHTTDQIAAGAPEADKSAVADTASATEAPQETEAAPEILFTTLTESQDSILYSNSSSGAIPENSSESAETAASSPVTEAETSAPAVGSNHATTEVPAVPETSTAPKRTEATVSPSVGPAPDYVKDRETSATESSTAATTAALSAGVTSVTETPQEKPLFRLIRALVGDDALDTWLAAYTGSEADAAVTACRDFAITAEALRTQGETMDIAVPAWILAELEG